MKKGKLLLLFFVLLAMGTHVNAQEKFRVQAMFIYNFARMTAWPQNYQSGDFVIGVYGNSPVYKEMSDLSSMRNIGSQPVKIKQFNSLDEVEKCHILFVAPGHSRQMADISQTLKQRNVSAMLISESRNAISDGAVVNFIIENDRPRYEISTTNARAMGLALGADITRLASSVK